MSRLTANFSTYVYQEPKWCLCCVPRESEPCHRVIDDIACSMSRDNLYYEIKTIYQAVKYIYSDQEFLAKLDKAKEKALDEIAKYTNDQVRPKAFSKPQAFSPPID